jgi:hypothetical protein
MILCGPKWQRLVGTIVQQFFSPWRYGKVGEHALMRTA